MPESFSSFLQRLQTLWMKKWQSMDTNHLWQKDERILPGQHSIVAYVENADIFEKAAINYSLVEGSSLPKAALPPSNQDLAGSRFCAMGISTILHPSNPFVPIAHCNLRFFQTLTEPSLWWYAAVMDLNPCFGFIQDCQHWHRVCKKACESAGSQDYYRFKQACDDYYYLPHRKEHRGIGGLWLERLTSPSAEQCRTLVESIGQHFLKAYLPIVTARHHHPYQPTHKVFQQYRRARYAEFNLLYDRGTRFGLEFGGRTDAIFVSMPPSAKWQYAPSNEHKTYEKELITTYLTPKDWLQTTPTSQSDHEITPC